MYTVLYVDKYKITFKLVSSGLSRPGIIDARARYRTRPGVSETLPYRVLQHINYFSQVGTLIFLLSGLLNRVEKLSAW